MTFQTDFWVTVLAYGGMFLGVLLAFDGLRQMLSRSESDADARNRRMRMIARGSDTAERLRILKPAAGEGWVARVPAISNLPRTLAQAGITVPAGVFVLLCLAVFLAVAAAGAMVAGVPAGAAAGLVAGIALPAAMVARRRRNRIATLVRQLPDALDLMARGLRVGHPLNATIASVANDMADPVAAEFGIMVDQIAFGDTLVDAVHDFAGRYDIEDIRYLSVSVGIQHGTGGDLAQILSTLARVIRNRLSLRKRILAISAEGRATSVFLSLLPGLILVATSITAPGYYWGVADDPWFRPFAITVGFLVALNFVVMRWLVNFRI